jgi:hypothetical protein
MGGKVASEPNVNLGWAAKAGIAAIATVAIATRALLRRFMRELLEV